MIYRFFRFRPLLQIFKFVSRVNSFSSIPLNFDNFLEFSQFFQISSIRIMAQEPFQVVLATREYPFPFLLSAKQFIKFSVVCFRLHRSWLHRLFMFGCSAFSLNLRVSRPTVIMINKTNSREITKSHCCCASGNIAANRHETKNILHETM